MVTFDGASGARDTANRMMNEMGLPRVAKRRRRRVPAAGVGEYTLRDDHGGFSGRTK